ncbi:MAG: hypothetical protein CMG07_03890 [Candidatus Marinimicrobia bacterium]|nr:hypothetical protein [Candidatus Neomarinimicrobiota bacterium]
MKNKIISSIDIGTNTITLLVAKINQASIFPLYEKEFITSLGEGLSINKSIKKDAIDRCLKNLITCKNIIKKYNVEDEFCVATSALRQAKNKTEIIKKINDINIYPKIISGDEEANLIGTVIKNEFPLLCKNALVIDIGGGSTELIYFKNYKIKYKRSFEIGSVTLYEKIFCDPINQSNIESCLNYINNKFNDISINNKIDFLIGVGGTITSLSAIYNNIIPYDKQIIHKSKIPKKAFSLLDKKLLHNSVLDRVKIPVLEYKRALVIPAGYLIFSFLFKKFFFNEISVCEKGLKWGVVFNELR